MPDQAGQYEAVAGNGDIVPFGTPGSEGEIILSDTLPFHEKYDIAIRITDPVLAALYFEACVQQTMKQGKSRVEAEAMERTTIFFLLSKVDDEEKQKKTYELYKEKDEQPPSQP